MWLNCLSVCLCWSCFCVHSACTNVQKVSWCIGKSLHTELLGMLLVYINNQILWCILEECRILHVCWLSFSWWLLVILWLYKEQLFTLSPAIANYPKSSFVCVFYHSLGTVTPLHNLLPRQHHCRKEIYKRVANPNWLCWGVAKIKVGNKSMHSIGMPTKQGVDWGPRRLSTCQSVHFFSQSIINDRLILQWWLYQRGRDAAEPITVLYLQWLVKWRAWSCWVWYGVLCLVM